MVVSTEYVRDKLSKNISSLVKKGINISDLQEIIDSIIEHNELLVQTEIVLTKYHERIEKLEKTKFKD